MRAPAWIIPALVVACSAAGVGGSKLVVAPSLVREYAAGATQATTPTDARTSQFVVKGVKCVDTAERRGQRADLLEQRLKHSYRSFARA